MSAGGAGLCRVLIGAMNSLGAAKVGWRRRPQPPKEGAGRVLLRAAAYGIDLGMLTLPIAPLTKPAFAPFGEVIETGGAKPKLINDGFARRFDGLARIDVAAEGGAVNISLFDGSIRPNPVLVKLMERHPLGSQLFMPLNEQPWLVVVCADPRVPASYRAFSASGLQGVNYARNIWHHPLLVLTDASPFLVIDRSGPGDNLEEVRLAEADWLALAPHAA